MRALTALAERGTLAALSRTGAFDLDEQAKKTALRMIPYGLFVLLEMDALTLKEVGVNYGG